MAVGEARHDQLAPPIDAFRIGKARHDLVGRTHGRDQVVFDGDGGIEAHGRVAISRYDRGVVNDGGHGA